MRSKTIYKYVLIAICFVFIQCKTRLTEKYINKQNNQTMERLNISDFKKIKEINTEEKQVLGGFSESLGDRKYYFSYYEKDKTTGKEINISGDKKTGYSKEITYRNSPYKERLDFYPNGNLRHQVTGYIGNLRKEKDGVLRRPPFSLRPFPVGKGYKYNEKGDIIEEIDHDKGYIISIEDLSKILLDEKEIVLNRDVYGVKKRTYEQISSWIKDEVKDKEDSGYWFISLKERRGILVTRVIIISGQTGKILYDKIVNETD